MSSLQATQWHGNILLLLWLKCAIWDENTASDAIEAVSKPWYISFCGLIKRRLATIQPHLRQWYTNSFKNNFLIVYMIPCIVLIFEMLNVHGIQHSFLTDEWIFFTLGGNWQPNTLYHLAYRDHTLSSLWDRNIERHTAHTIFARPNPNQWIIVHNGPGDINSLVSKSTFQMLIVQRQPHSFLTEEYVLLWYNRRLQCRKGHTGLVNNLQPNMNDCRYYNWEILSEHWSSSCRPPQEINET